MDEDAGGAGTVDALRTQTGLSGSDLGSFIASAFRGGPTIGQESGGGLPSGYLGYVEQRESGGNPTAQSRTSSAFGPYQFTKGTWGDVAKAHPDLNLPDDPRNATRDQHDAAMTAFSMDNANTLRSNNIPVTQGNLYLTHVLGAGDGIKAIRAGYDAPLSSVVGDKVLDANPPFRQWTVGRLAGSSQETAPSNEPPSSFSRLFAGSRGAPPVTQQQDQAIARQLAGGAAPGAPGGGGGGTQFQPVAPLSSSVTPGMNPYSQNALRIRDALMRLGGPGGGPPVGMALPKVPSVQDRIIALLQKQRGIPPQQGQG